MKSTVKNCDKKTIKKKGKNNWTIKIWKTEPWYDFFSNDDQWNHFGYTPVTRLI